VKSGGSLFGLAGVLRVLYGTTAITYNLRPVRIAPAVWGVHCVPGSSWKKCWQAVDKENRYK